MPLQHGVTWRAIAPVAWHARDSIGADMVCCPPAGVYGLGFGSLFQLTDSYWAQPRRVPSVPQCPFMGASVENQHTPEHEERRVWFLVPPQSSSGNGNTFRHVLGASPPCASDAACCAMSCPPTYLPT
jgi:hypothetical protein